MTYRMKAVPRAPALLKLAGIMMVDALYAWCQHDARA